MKFGEVWRQFTPNYMGGVMGAIFIAIVLGQVPSRQNVLWLILAFILIFIFGVVYTWIMLLAWPSQNKSSSRNK